MVLGRSTGLRLLELNSCACSRCSFGDPHPGGAPKAARRLAAVGGRAAGWGEPPRRTSERGRARARGRRSFVWPCMAAPSSARPSRRDRAWRRYPPRPRGRRRSRDVEADRDLRGLEHHPVALGRVAEVELDHGAVRRKLVVIDVAGHPDDQEVGIELLGRGSVNDHVTPTRRAPARPTPGRGRRVSHTPRVLPLGPSDAR